MSFELRGRSGRERVTIYKESNEALIDKTTLTKNWMQFSFTSVENIRIHFDYESSRGKDDDVFFRDAKDFVIEFQDRKWNEKHACGSHNESYRCSDVRNGSLFWGGTYLVSKKKGTYI